MFMHLFGPEGKVVVSEVGKIWVRLILSPEPEKSVIIPARQKTARGYLGGNAYNSFKE